MKPEKSTHPDALDIPKMPGRGMLQDGAPPVISWIIIPLTIDISTISPSYWSVSTALCFQSLMATLLRRIGQKNPIQQLTNLYPQTTVCDVPQTTGEEHGGQRQSHLARAMISTSCRGYSQTDDGRARPRECEVSKVFKCYLK